MRSLRAIANYFHAVSFTLFSSVAVYCLFPVAPSGRLGRAWAYKVWGPALVKGCGLNLRVHGLEKIDPDKPYLFVSNHMSHFDVPVLYTALGRWVSFVAKKELVRIPVFGPAMKWIGTVVIDRSNQDKARKSLQEAGEKMRGGLSVFMFPEGTRSPTFEIRDFKKGAFTLAVQARVPVVPIVIEGTQRVLPRNTLRIFQDQVDVHILDPVPLAGDLPENSDAQKQERDMLLNSVRSVMVDFQQRVRGKQNAA